MCVKNFNNLDPQSQFVGRSELEPTSLRKQELQARQKELELGHRFPQRDGPTGNPCVFSWLVLDETFCTFVDQNLLFLLPFMYSKLKWEEESGNVRKETFPLNFLLLCNWDLLTTPSGGGGRVTGKKLRPIHRVSQGRSECVAQRSTRNSKKTSGPMCHLKKRKDTCGKINDRGERQIDPLESSSEWEAISCWSLLVSWPCLPCPFCPNSQLGTPLFRNGSVLSEAWLL